MIFLESHHKAAEYTFFSSAYKTFSKIDYMLGHKTSLNTFKKIEIISSVYTNPNGMKLNNDYKKKKLKNTQTHGGLSLIHI